MPIVAPPAAARVLRHTAHPVRLVRPGEATDVAGVSVRATAAVHDGRRVPLGGATPAVGFLVEGVYFAGDTALFPAMAELDVDVALLPIAGWGARLGPGHMDARQAAEALALLEPRVAVPIHWGTYRPLGGRARPGDPARDFAAHAAELAPGVRVVVLRPGESVEITPPAPHLR